MIRIANNKKEDASKAPFIYVAPKSPSKGYLLII